LFWFFHVDNKDLPSLTFPDRHTDSQFSPRYHGRNQRRADDPKILYAALRNSSRLLVRQLPRARAKGIANVVLIVRTKVLKNPIQFPSSGICPKSA
jgi:hypothetical protein